MIHRYNASFRRRQRLRESREHVYTNIELVQQDICIALLQWLQFSGVETQPLFGYENTSCNIISYNETKSQVHLRPPIPILEYSTAGGPPSGNSEHPDLLYR